MGFSRATLANELIHVKPGKSSMTASKPGDKRTFRTFKLDNELQVLLISDPELNKSAAAMCVSAGSMQDPPDKLGVAHYLEHLLFLGTKKYPDPNSYSKYLQANQGYSNAYTAREYTNYFFEVNHDAYEGALDRFSRFFTEPKFDPDFVLRELNAVNSEHQKNLLDDGWRTRQLARAEMKKGHPQTYFATGSIDTLENASRQDIIDFYKREYSANIMNLVLLSPYPLDKMQKWSKELFAAIPNIKRKQHIYDEEIFAKDEMPKITFAKSVKDIRQLQLSFPAPSGFPYWKSKPFNAIAHLIGHEGEGSLLSLLKKQNLATGLSAGAMSYTHASLFDITITLTELGVKEYDKVISYFFSYVKMLQKEGYKKHLYDELATMAKIDFTYREHEEGGWVASRFANLMQRYPPLEIEKNSYLFFEYKPQDFKRFVDLINPNNLYAMLIHKDVKGNKKEQYYGTEYRTEKFSKEQVKTWQDVKLLDALHYPKPNEFIPKNLALLPSAKVAKPEKIIDNKWGQFWFQKDEEFRLPKASVSLLLFSEAVNRTPREKMLAVLYYLSLKHKLNEWKYPISQAGLNFSIVRQDRGIRLSFSGYSENIPRLMKAMSEKLTDIDIDQKSFENQKDELKRVILNMKHDAAYRQAFYQARYLTDDRMIHPHSYFNPDDKNVDMLSSVTLDEVKKFVKEIYKEISLEGAAYGNLNAEKLKQAILSFPATLKAKPVSKKKFFRNRTVKLPSGKPLVYAFKSDINNTAWISLVQFGQRTPKLHALLEIAATHIHAPFYGELRTKQQLGYAVFSGLNAKEKVLGLYFAVQSDKYSPEEISKRAYDFIEKTKKDLDKMTDKEFDGYKAAIIRKLEEKEKTFDEKLSTLISEAIVLEGQFDYRKKVAAEVKKISKKEFIQSFRNGFKADKEASLAIYLYNDAKKSPKPRGELIKNARKFKEMSPKY